jgi:hypothetical protein
VKYRKPSSSLCSSYIDDIIAAAKHARRVSMTKYAQEEFENRQLLRYHKFQMFPPLFEVTDLLGGEHS